MLRNNCKFGDRGRKGVVCSTSPKLNLIGGLRLTMTLKLTFGAKEVQWIWGCGREGHRAWSLPHTFPGKILGLWWPPGFCFILLFPAESWSGLRRLKRLAVTWLSWISCPDLVEFTLMGRQSPRPPLCLSFCRGDKAAPVRTQVRRFVSENWK